MAKFKIGDVVRTKDGIFSQYNNFIGCVTQVRHGSTGVCYIVVGDKSKSRPDVGGFDEDAIDRWFDPEDPT
jgi:hypothetical protein